MLPFCSSHSIVTRGSRVSRASPHQTLPAFRNLSGAIIFVIKNSSLKYFVRMHIKQYSILKIPNKLQE